MKLKINDSFNKVCLVFLMVLLMTGCATTSNIDVINQDLLQNNFTINNVVAKNETGNTFEIEIESMLEKAMNEELSLKGLSNKEGLEYELQVFIIQYKEGNAFARWVMPGMGKTVLSVEAILTDESGNSVLQSQATRSIGAGGGYTINAWKRVFNQVAEELIDDLASVKDN
tara:strand:- start:1508 stop:2020 length:513 start_codon:yes stop_codon:yes gene_type:complete